MSKTTPVRWWRDDITRYHTRGAQIVPAQEVSCSRWESLSAPPDPLTDILGFIDKQRMDIARHNRDQHRRNGCPSAYSCQHCNREFCWLCEAPCIGLPVKTIGNRFCDAPACVEAEAKVNGLPVERILELRAKSFARRWM